MEARCPSASNGNYIRLIHGERKGVEAQWVALGCQTASTDCLKLVLHESKTHAHQTITVIPGAKMYGLYRLSGPSELSDRGSVFEGNVNDHQDFGSTRRYLTEPARRTVVEFHSFSVRHANRGRTSPGQLV